MKFEQQAEFKPITLTIETAREAEFIWDMVRKYAPKGPVEIHIINEMNDWLTNTAQLGG